MNWKKNSEILSILRTSEPAGGSGRGEEEFKWFPPRWPQDCEASLSTVRPYPEEDHKKREDEFSSASLTWWRSTPRPSAVWRWRSTPLFLFWASRWWESNGCRILLSRSWAMQVSLVPPIIWIIQVSEVECIVVREPSPLDYKPWGEICEK